jgi:16S rRNA (guanine527-N7)-methyltransferase
VTGPEPSQFAAQRAAVLSALNVSRETEADLDAFVALLLKWQATTNLIANSTIPEIWTRHILDSAQLLPLIGDARVIVDLGSGAGFPGLVLAILLKERDRAEVHLVESNGRKASFLRDVVREARAPVSVHQERIETLVPRFDGKVDVITARALAPLGELLALSLPLLKRRAVGLFLKGRGAERELTDSRKSWRIDADLIPSVTDPSARIVMVRAAERLGPRASHGWMDP